MPRSRFATALSPAGWRAWLGARPHVQRVVTNTGWLLGDRIFRMAVGLLVGIWVARYLGAAQFGLIAYATAIVTLATPLATLGLDNIVVRDLVRRQHDPGLTLGTCVLLQLAGSVAAMAVAVAVVSALRPSDTLARVAVAVLALGVLFKATDAVKFWFESRVEAKHTVRAETVAVALFALVKVALVLAGAPLLAFLWVVPAEAAIASALVVAAYLRQGHTLRSWSYQRERARGLLRDGTPLVLSAMASVVYMRIDQVMLGQMLGDHAVGIFSAASRISEMWYFVPMAIASSVFPAILAARQTDAALYHRHLQRLFSLMTVLAVATALPVSLFADRIVTLLYGHGFAGAAPILVVHVWTGLFVFHGVAGSRWFLAENLQRMMFYRTLAGCLVNVALNLVLIPRFGALGAAWASVAAQAVAALLMNALYARTRPIFFMQLRALALSSLFSGGHAASR